MGRGAGRCRLQFRNAVPETGTDDDEMETEQPCTTPWKRAKTVMGLDISVLEATDDVFDLRWTQKRWYVTEALVRELGRTMGRSCHRLSARPSWMKCGPRRLPRPIIRQEAGCLSKTHGRAPDVDGGSAWSFFFHSRVGLSDLGPVFDWPPQVVFDAQRQFVVGLTAKLVVFGRHAGWSNASSLYSCTIVCVVLWTCGVVVG